MSQPPKPRILIGDYAVTKYQATIDWLAKEGVETVAVTDPMQFLFHLRNDSFEIVIINLLLGSIGPFELLKEIRTTSKNKDVGVMVVSKQVHKENIENTIKAGANDFVVDPFDAVTLGHRVLYHMSPKKEIPPPGVEQKPLKHVDWNVVKLLVDGIEDLSRLRREQGHETFHRVLESIAKYLDSNRTSLIIVDKESNVGIVLASSDDPKFHDFPISLQSYPEVLHVVNTGNTVLVENVASNLMTHRIREKVKSIEIGSMMVFPIRFENDICGVVTIRRPKAKELPPLETLRVLHALANTMAAHSNMKMLLRKIYKDYSKKAG